MYSSSCKAQTYSDLCFQKRNACQPCVQFYILIQIIYVPVVLQHLYRLTVTLAPYPYLNELSECIILCMKCFLKLTFFFQINELSHVNIPVMLLPDDFRAYSKIKVDNHLFNKLDHTKSTSFEIGILMFFFSSSFYLQRKHAITFQS